MLQPNCVLDADGATQVGNFLAFSETALCFDEIVKDVMGDFLEAAGEIFPLHIDGLDTKYVLNVLETCNPVDKSRSIVDPRDWRATITRKQLQFHKKRISSFSSLFKIPDLQYYPVLTFSEHESHDHDFRKAYKANNLSGLVFDELWSTDQGSCRQQSCAKSVRRQ